MNASCRHKVEYYIVGGYRGKVDQAFAWLDRSYVKGDPGLNQLKLDPLLKNLRADPRDSDLLKKMRLPVRN